MKKILSMMIVILVEGCSNETKTKMPLPLLNPNTGIVVPSATIEMLVPLTNNEATR